MKGMTLSGIIKPPRPRRLPDPFITPIFGTRGPCALCRNYSDLTEDHIPPAGTGNTDRWVARSYMTTASGSEELYFGREFRGGVRFRTLCASCNNGLGAKEDRAIIDFYERVRKLVESPLTITGTIKVPAKPNQIIKGLAAHITSANDSGCPSTFDGEARNLFFGRKPLSLSSWNLFYWIYRNDSMFLMRDAFLATWSPTVQLFPMHILKAYPLAFLFTQKPSFLGTPNMMMFIQKNDNDEFDVPVDLHRFENHPVWPVAAGPNEAIFLGGSSFGLVSAPQ